MSDIPSDCPGIGSENAGNGTPCAGCPNQKFCLSGEKAPTDPSILLVSERLKSVKSVILVLSGKGGVGKSTVAAQLAYMLSRDPDKQIGLLDIDICGPSQPLLMGMQGQEVHASASGWSPVYHEEFPNLGVMSIGFLIPSDDAPIIWRGPKKNGLIKQFLTDVDWGSLDYLVIDCPPGTSDEHISIATFLSEVPNTAALIVTTPHELSIIDVRKEIGFCRKTNIKVIGVVENMSGFLCPNCDCTSVLFPSNPGGTNKMCEETNTYAIASIPISISLSTASNLGKPLLETDHIVYGLYQTIANTIIKYFY
jgi:Mrp family chromosome partitioning ATPase